MELREERDGWRFSLDSGFVQLIQIDFRLGLCLADTSGTAQLYIETECRLNGGSSEVLLTPANPSTLAPVLPLFNRKVVTATIRKTGQLKVEFGGGYTLQVEPDNSYEAWQLGCSLGFMVVCAPGGSVSVFRHIVRSTAGT